MKRAILALMLLAAPAAAQQDSQLITTVLVTGGSSDGQCAVHGPALTVAASMAGTTCPDGSDWRFQYFAHKQVTVTGVGISIGNAFATTNGCEFVVQTAPAGSTTWTSVYTTNLPSSNVGIAANSYRASTITPFSLGVGTRLRVAVGDGAFCASGTCVCDETDLLHFFLLGN